MSKETAVVLERYTGNPILLPQKDSAWQSLNVSNAAATVHDGKVVCCTVRKERTAAVDPSHGR